MLFLNKIEIAKHYLLIATSLSVSSLASGQGSVKEHKVISSTLSGFLVMLDNMSLYADMSGLCKKGWNGFGWSYYSATWKYFKGIFLVIFHY